METTIYCVIIIFLVAWILLAHLAISIQGKMIIAKNKTIASMKEENKKRSERVKNWYKFTNNLG